MKPSIDQPAPDATAEMPVCAQVFELLNEFDSDHGLEPCAIRHSSYVAMSRCGEELPNHWLDGLADPVLNLDRQELAAVEASLRRIYDGRGPRCKECGRRMTVQRLAAQTSTNGAARL